jgi:hypothetical protein
MCQVPELAGMPPDFDIFKKVVKVTAYILRGTVMKTIAFAVAVATLGMTEAKANHYMQTADPQVVNAINEMIGALSQGCNYGNSAACNAVVLLQQQAHFMLSAGYDCSQRGDQQACAFYNQNYGQLEQAYNELSMIMQNGGLVQNTGGGQGMGLTHEQRMQQIHDFGAQNTANFQARQATMDQNHQNFLATIRE